MTSGSRFPASGPATVRLRLLCRGVVQGVGFRPCLHRLAVALGLRGSAENVAAGVQLELWGTRPRLERFLASLPAALPAAARLEPPVPEWFCVADAGTPTGPPGLRIAAAPPRPLGIGLFAPALAADQAPCAACLAELADPSDRRHGYPFISCSSCGPRYSIATAEPYCRAHTTLAAFPLCPACRREFEDPADRRFHAETVGCPACGPRLRFLDAAGRPLSRDPLAAAVALLRGGGILALQGVGGFQLLVDAADAAAVARLRQRKRRPAKPFALLAATPASLQAFCRIDSSERAVLAGPAAPIVLLRRRHEALEALPGVAPGSACLGGMLPASPLHHLLAVGFGGPLVATSGNPSGEPLCIDPGEAVARLGASAAMPIADAFLVHDRPIARPLDDSVVQVIEGRPVLLRRARGHAPEPLELPDPEPDPEPEPQAISGGHAPAVLLALGGDLKCAPGLAREGRVWLAPHLGDVAAGPVLERLRAGLAEALEGGATAALALACDAHPGYLTHQLAHAREARPQEVPHHLAHALAVLAEHGVEPPLLALTLDGIGYAPGPGHRLRGGELLRLTADGHQWLAGLRPFPLPGGTQAITEPRRVALGLLAAAGGDGLDHPGASRTREAFTVHERRLLLQAVRAGCNSPLCSAAGRLFDAAASLLGLCQVLSHEGEGGQRLEGAAAAAPRERGAYPLPLVCPGEAPPLGWLDWQPLLANLLADVAAGVTAPVCAVRFHRGLARGLAAAAAAAAAPQPGTPVALAGGCFQNRLLLELTADALRRRGLRPLWSVQAPGNDGGLALGQIQALRGLHRRRPEGMPSSADVPINGQEMEPCGSRDHVPGRRRSDPLDRDPAAG
jgi:hydrogenase maturation protein HypF